MKLDFQARNKFAFVDGSCVKSAFATSDVLYAQWDGCNVVVLTWIMNSVSSHVYVGLVYFVDTASVWKELESTYDKVNVSVIFNLLQRITSIEQGSSVADYYHRLNSLWRDFDALTNLPTYDCYQSVKSALLTKDPLPEVKDAYTTVSRKESYRGIPQPSSVTESKINATFFVAKGDVKSNEKQQLSAYHSSSSFTAEQMRKLLSLISDTPNTVHANMSGRASFFKV
ncbi:ribonuclease H-like domain-containing protein, partial [Tanacetum coccineum]